MNGGFLWEGSVPGREVTVEILLGIFPDLLRCSDVKGSEKRHYKNFDSNFEYDLFVRIWIIRFKSNPKD